MNLQKPGGEHTIDYDLLPDDPLILDVGCRGFEFDLAILRIRPRGFAIAYDPDPLLEAPAHPHIFFHHAAVTHLAKKDVVQWQGTGEGSYIADNPEGYRWGLSDPEQSFSVRNVSLDEITAVIPLFDVVKLDCEGSEFGILENWPGPIAKQISVEFHDYVDRNRWSDEYFEKLFAGPLRDYRVVQHELTPVGPLNAMGHWDTLLVLR